MIKNITIIIAIMWLKFTLLEHDKKVKERHEIFPHETIVKGGDVPDAGRGLPQEVLWVTTQTSLTMQSILSWNGQSVKWITGVTVMKHHSYSSARP